jgi:hypothetical protein
MRTAVQILKYRYSIGTVFDTTVSHYFWKDTDYLKLFSEPFLFVLFNYCTVYSYIYSK